MVVLSGITASNTYSAWRQIATHVNSKQTVYIVFAPSAPFSATIMTMMMMLLLWKTLISNRAESEIQQE